MDNRITASSFAGSTLVLPHTVYMDTADLDAELDELAAYHRQRQRRIRYSTEPGSAGLSGCSAQPDADAQAERPPDLSTELPAWLAAYFGRPLHPLTRAHIARAWQLQTFTAAQIAADTGGTVRRAGQSISQLRRKRLLVKVTHHQQAVYKWRTDPQEEAQQDCA